MDRNIRLSSPQPRYSFTVDPEQGSPSSSGDVEFIMYLVDAERRHTDPNEARARIDSLGADVRYKTYLNSSAALIATTDQATYERLFQTTLEYEPRNAGVGGYTTKGYREPTAGRPLTELADIVQSAHLNYIRRF
ncbi:hypothetical protein HY495_03055 [Candidatus Woesearchaeota archaeon]|nr:hypothetical protein [Candidatus Woesearchaeota archaeon]